MKKLLYSACFFFLIYNIYLIKPTNALSCTFNRTVVYSCEQGECKYGFFAPYGGEGPCTESQDPSFDGTVDTYSKTKIEDFLVYVTYRMYESGAPLLMEMDELDGVYELVFSRDLISNELDEGDYEDIRLDYISNYGKEPEDYKSKYEGMLRLYQERNSRGISEGGEKYWKIPTTKGDVLNFTSTEGRMTIKKLGEGTGKELIENYKKSYFDEYNNKKVAKESVGFVSIVIWILAVLYPFPFVKVRSKAIYKSTALVKGIFLVISLASLFLSSFWGTSLFVMYGVPLIVSIPLSFLYIKKKLRKLQ